MSAPTGRDLDRCPHGRHQHDRCLDCEHADAPTNEHGWPHFPNPFLDNVAGYGVRGEPITVRALMTAARGEENGR